MAQRDPLYHITSRFRAAFLRCDICLGRKCALTGAWKLLTFQGSKPCWQRAMRGGLSKRLILGLGKVLARVVGRLFRSLDGLLSTATRTPQTNITYEAVWRLWTRRLVPMRTDAYICTSRWEGRRQRERQRNTGCICNVVLRHRCSQGKLVGVQQFHDGVGKYSTLKHSIVKSGKPSVSRESA